MANDKVVIPPNPNTGLIVSRPFSSLPPGSILLSPHEVRNLQWQRVQNWHPQEDVWPLRYGTTLLSMATGVTAYVTMLGVRRQFHLPTQRFFTTLAPAVGVPALFITFAYRRLVQDSVLKGYNLCPICYEIRGALLQGTLGVVTPLVLSILVCMPVARLEKTYPVPSPTDWRGILNVTRLTIRSSRVSLSVMTICSLLLGGWMANKCIDTVHYMQARDENIIDYVHKEGYTKEVLGIK